MKKKISIITAYTLLGFFVLTLILCAVININFRPEMKLPVYADGDQIEISVPGTSKYQSNKDEINYDKFVKKFNNSFKLTILYSLFSGHLGNEIEVGEDQTTEPSYAGYKVQFTFMQPQELKKNGKVVPIADNSPDAITFSGIVFDVAEGKGLTKVDLFFIIGEGKYKKVSSIANFDGLYKHISEISMFKD